LGVFRGRLVIAGALFQLTAACGTTSQPVATDGGQASSGGLDGGRRPSSWREGVSPIVADVEGWQVPPEDERILYPADRTHSPLTATIASHLRNIALHGQNLEDNVFMKVGDSITASAYFMGCYMGDVNGKAQSWEFNIVLDGRESLAEAIFHFRTGVLGRNTSFDRTSRAAKVGATADWAISGRTPPLEVELTATRAQFATVMYGTNDVGIGGAADVALETKLVPYTRNLRSVIDWLLLRGVVPLMSTIPPRTDEPDYLGLVDVMNAVVRAVAQARQLPLVDFHREMLPLLDYGLSGDGVHPSIESYNTGCQFHEEGLSYGYDMRNLVTIEGLHRLMHVVVDGAPSLDEHGERLQGQGTRADPLLIPSLPFSDMRDVKGARENQLDGYSCAGARAGTGNEIVYKVTLNAPTRVRAAVMDATAVGGADAGVLPLDVDLHVLDESGTAAGCRNSVDKVLVTNLPAGTWYFSVDRDLATSLAPTGEFVFLVVPCSADDRLCADLAGL
jgi:hypothetical protein